MVPGGAKRRPFTATQAAAPSISSAGTTITTTSRQAVKLTRPRDRGGAPPEMPPFFTALSFHRRGRGSRPTVVGSPFQLGNEIPSWMTISTRSRPGPAAKSCVVPPAVSMTSPAWHCDRPGPAFLQEPWIVRSPRADDAGNALLATGPDSPTPSQRRRHRPGNGSTARPGTERRSTRFRRRSGPEPPAVPGHRDRTSDEEREKMPENDRGWPRSPTAATARRGPRGRGKRVGKARESLAGQSDFFLEIGGTVYRRLHVLASSFGQDAEHIFGHQIARAAAHASPPIGAGAASCLRRWASARARRDLTVPTGMANRSAKSVALMPS